jgi:hypothetical protein
MLQEIRKSNHLLKGDICEPCVAISAREVGRHQEDVHGT